MFKIFKSSRKSYPDPNPGSALFEIDNWYISELVVEKIVPMVGLHPFPLNELLLMVGSVARIKPSMIFEWGTHIGKSARIFYEASEALGLKTIIHSIDLPESVEHVEHPHEQRGRLVAELKRVELHEGDGIDTALSVLVKQDDKLRNGRGVLFFIDGDHTYKSVRRELSAILNEAPEATILLHDSFYQSPDAGYNIGVYKAINDCLKQSPRKYKRLDTGTGLPGMTLLYR